NSDCRLRSCHAVLSRQSFSVGGSLVLRPIRLCATKAEGISRRICATPDGNESFSPCASPQCKHASRRLRTLVSSFAICYLHALGSTRDGEQTVGKAARPRT